MLWHSKLKKIKYLSYYLRILSILECVILELSICVHTKAMARFRGLEEANAVFIYLRYQGRIVELGIDGDIYLVREE